MKNLKNALFSAFVVVAAFCCAWFGLHQPHASTSTNAPETTQTSKSKDGNSGNSSIYSNRAVAKRQPEHNRVRADAPVGSKSKNSELSEGLSQLDIPSICTDDLPGLVFKDHKKALVAIRDVILEESANRKSVNETTPAVQQQHQAGVHSPPLGGNALSNQNSAIVPATAGSSAFQTNADKIARLLNGI